MKLCVNVIQGLHGELVAIQLMEWLQAFVFLPVLLRGMEDSEDFWTLGQSTVEKSGRGLLATLPSAA